MKGYANTLVLTIILLIGCSTEQDTSSVHSRLNEERRLLYAELDSIRAIIHHEREWQYNPKETARRLEQLGVENPIHRITEDLRSKPGLIPDNTPERHLKLQFSDVFVLSPSWVLALYDDGHIGFKMLLRFEFQGPDSLKWTVLDTSTN